MEENSFWKGCSSERCEIPGVGSLVRNYGWRMLLLTMWVEPKSDGDGAHSNPGVSVEVTK